MRERRFRSSACYFFFGTFLPSRRASESPMAMACFGLVTFLPLRPDLSLPCFISLISVSTFLPAEGEYFRPEDFFFDEDFFVLVLRRELLFFALVLRREELLELRLRPLLNFFFEAFLVAMAILLKNQMFFRFESVAWFVKGSA